MDVVISSARGNPDSTHETEFIESQEVPLNNKYNVFCGYRGTVLSLAMPSVLGVKQKDDAICCTLGRRSCVLEV